MPGCGASSGPASVPLSRPTPSRACLLYSSKRIKLSVSIVSRYSSKGLLIHSPLFICHSYIQMDPLLMRSASGQCLPVMDNCVTVAARFKEVPALILVITEYAGYLFFFFETGQCLLKLSFIPISQSQIDPAHVWFADTADFRVLPQERQSVFLLKSIRLQTSIIPNAT